MSGQEIRWPRIWLMSDESMGERFWDAVAALPPGDGGVILRHDGIGEIARGEMAKRLRLYTREHGLKFGVARDWQLATAVGADLLHDSLTIYDIPLSMPVHDELEADKARVWGASLAFVSPLFATPSHPDAEPLGVERAKAIAKSLPCKSIALGGMNAETWREVGKPFHGWAGISAFL